MTLAISIRQPWASLILLAGKDREAVRRLVRWNLEAYDSEVVEGVYIWFTLNGMAGPLPPLPKRVVKREQLLRDPEAHC